ncbi:MAG: DUF1080 domain-containing protein [Opitutales bacterium]|nr:DUF1080 domain-containing protein [Opitutales bacterium]
MNKTLLNVTVILLSYVTLPAGEWVSLFDNKTLDGWTQKGGKAHFTVEDGAIVGIAVKNTPNSFLCTEDIFGDFILEFDVKQEGKCNSGVMFRALSHADYRNYRVHGYQCEIDPSERAWTGGIYDEARRGWICRPQHNPKVKDAYQYGRWNRFRIEAIGDKILTYVNGILVSYLCDNMTSEGFIGLQVHSVGSHGKAGDRIMWKNIRIMTDDLPPVADDADILIRNHIPNTLCVAEKTQGWELLWDGKTTKGWRRAHEAEFPEQGWKIKDGVLTIESSGGGESKYAGDIVTTEEYSAFELQLEFKISEGANSGIKYFVTEGYGMKVGAGSAIGFEYQILDDKNHPDALEGTAGNRTMASLYDLIPSKKVVIGREISRKPGVWHHARLIVTPCGKIEHWLNGFKVVKYEKGSPLMDALIQLSKYKDWKGFGKWESGHILLQDHGDEVHFRSIKIRDAININ